jgi:uncharacterized protein (TIGR03790 family)
MSSVRTRIIACVIGGLLAGEFLAGAARAAGTLADSVVVLANARQPESVELAQFYAKARAIPAENVIALPMPTEESITWREFIDQVWQPLQDELHRRHWIEGASSDLLDRYGRRRYARDSHRIAFLVTCRGVPLRIYADPTLLPEKSDRRIRAEFNTNAGAVDAELSLIAVGGYELVGVQPNPLFGREHPTAFDEEMVVKVSRLDGPTWSSARNLVTSAVVAERAGPQGRYYVDLGGPEAEGDRWLRAARTTLQGLGFDGESEETPATFDAAARFDAPVFYFGWYAGSLNGPFARKGFVFPPGAVALHIHSFSAQTLRSDTSGWAGPLVARGVTATVGNVFEPYLGFTHRPDLLMQALAAGKNFGDAVYFALPTLSWEAIAIGDPLYRPFPAGGGVAGDSPYAVIRRANLLAASGQTAEARALLKSAQREQPSLALSLALAQRALADRDEAGAVAAVDFAQALKTFRAQDWPLLREIARLLAAHGARPAALQVYANLARVDAPTPEAFKAMLTEARQVADAAGDLLRSLDFAKQLSNLDPLPAAPATK